MKTLFISRNLKHRTPFETLETDFHVRVVDKSLVDIKPLPLTSVPDTDWVFFYSSNGIRCYFGNQDYDELKQYGVMGEASAKLFRSLTGQLPDFTGKGSQDEIGEAFEERLGDSSLLIVRARQSMNFLAARFPDDEGVHEVVAYDNTMRTNFELPDCDFLAFTSPLNAEAYFARYPYRDQKLYAIGETTAAKLKDITGKEPAYCEEPGMQNLYNLIRDDLKSG